MRRKLNEILEWFSFEPKINPLDDSTTRNYFPEFSNIQVLFPSRNRLVDRQRDERERYLKTVRESVGVTKEKDGKYKVVVGRNNAISVWVRQHRNLYIYSESVSLLDDRYRSYWKKKT